jgi:hypothetical protein
MQSIAMCNQLANWLGRGLFGVTRVLPGRPALQGWSQILWIFRVAIRFLDADRLDMMAEIGCRSGQAGEPNWQECRRLERQGPNRDQDAI